MSFQTLLYTLLYIYMACLSMPGGVGVVAGAVAGALMGTHGAAKVVSGSQMGSGVAFCGRMCFLFLRRVTPLLVLTLYERFPRFCIMVAGNHVLQAVSSACTCCCGANYLRGLFPHELTVCCVVPLYRCLVWYCCGSWSS